MHRECAHGAPRTTASSHHLHAHLGFAALVECHVCKAAKYGILLGVKVIHNLASKDKASSRKSYGQADLCGRKQEQIATELSHNHFRSHFHVLVSND